MNDDDTDLENLNVDIVDEINRDQKLTKKIFYNLFEIRNFISNNNTNSLRTNLRNLNQMKNV